MPEQIPLSLDLIFRYKESLPPTRQAPRDRSNTLRPFQIETRTWQALVAYRSKILARELVGQGKELDTAEDYLVR